MWDQKKLFDDIAATQFFSRMGAPSSPEAGVVYMPGVNEVFIDPEASDFHGLYEDLEWLQGTPTDEDPFHTFPKPPKELSDVRLEVSRAVLKAVKGAAREPFIVGAHDFSQAARNAACFAFRQYVSELYYESDSHWSRIVSFYLSGRWPVGHSRGVIVVI